MREERVTIQVGKEYVTGFLTKPDAKTFPLLLCIHGFTSSHRSSKIQQLTDILPKRGWGVLSFDLRFHGESPGAIDDIRIEKNVEDVRAAYRYVKKNIQGLENISLYGSSYGGMLAIILAIEKPEIPLLGLVAPVTDLAEQKGLAGNSTELQEWKSKGYYKWRNEFNGTTAKIKYQFYESLLPYHNKIFELAAKIQSNTFIVHGSDDRSVPLSLTKKFHSSLMCQKELVIVPGADHAFSQRIHFQNLIARLVEFYTTNL